MKRNAKGQTLKAEVPISDHEMIQFGGKLIPHGDKFGVVDRNAWLRAMGHIQHLEKAPEAEHIAIFQPAEGGLTVLDGAGKLAAGGCEANRVDIFLVAVRADQARLGHPVQKYFEAAKFMGRLIIGGIHVLRRNVAQAGASRKKDEVAK